MGKNNILTKQQAIQKIVSNVDSVDSWDLDCLVGYVKEHLEQLYEQRTTEEVEADYNLEFGGYYEDDEENYIKVVDTKASRLLIDGVKK